MIGESYPFLSEGYIPEKDELFFIFLSQGEEVIPKLVLFSPIEKGGHKYYNWGFGDITMIEKSGFQVDDKVESNNGDVKTVFYTVASTLSDFFERYPEATVHMEGSSQQRIEVMYM